MEKSKKKPVVFIGLLVGYTGKGENRHKNL